MISAIFLINMIKSLNPQQSVQWKFIIELNMITVNVTLIFFNGEINVNSRFVIWWIYKATLRYLLTIFYKIHFHITVYNLTDDQICFTLRVSLINFKLYINQVKCKTFFILLNVHFILGQIWEFERSNNVLFKYRIMYKIYTKSYKMNIFVCISKLLSWEVEILVLIMLKRISIKCI